MLPAEISASALAAISAGKIRRFFVTGPNLIRLLWGICSLDNNSERAVKFFKEGYNCSQAVLAVYCDELGVDFETAMKLSSSFGGGMGRLREVCGAVSSMFMVAGLKAGYKSPTDRIAKEEHYKLIQELAKRFEMKNGSIICRELLGLKVEHDTPVPEARTKNYYKKRPCSELVKCAVEILEEVMGGQP